MTATTSKFAALLDVAAEREAQNEKWGEQNHPDGTGRHSRLFGSANKYGHLAEKAKAITDLHAEHHIVTYADILAEEVFEALAEEDPAKLRAELVQVAAVAVQWVEAIDRRAK